MPAQTDDYDGDGWYWMGCGWRCSQVDASELILGNSIKLHSAHYHTVHNITQCTISHSAQYHTVHNITQCTISHSAQYHTVHRPPHSIEQRPVWHLCYWLWAGGMQAMTHHSTHTYCNTPHTQNERRDTHYWYTLYLTIWHTRHRVIKSWPSGCISLQEGTVQTMFECVKKPLWIPADMMCTASLKVQTKSNVRLEQLQRCPLLYFSLLNNNRCARNAAMQCGFYFDNTVSQWKQVWCIV